MVIPKEVKTDFKEIYDKAQHFVNEESKNDPPTDPYKSHYLARDLLVQLLSDIKNSLASLLAEEAEDGHGEDQFIYSVIMAYCIRDLARIHLFTEELDRGKELLNECLELVEAYKMTPEAIIAYVGALNEMGIVHANATENQASFEKLSQAEQAYQEFKASGKNALCLHDILGTPDEVEEGKGPKELESLYTMCTFYLAQVYGNLEQLEKSAQYCHITLRRQLEAKSYEPIDFGLNTATLSQYFIGQNMFKEARHYLAAATLIMAEHEVNMIKPEMSEQERADVTETFKHRYADVARCWAKYGLMLLSASKDRLYNDDDEKLTADTKLLCIDANAYCFPDLELSAYEDRVSADYCLTFDDAKLVFHFVINWLDQAKDYYKPDTEATEYAKIIKDYADLYQYIAFFEEDPVNQAKMQKRRAKYYEDLLELLNPVFYMSICRECWFGAGLAYNAILDIKLDALKASYSASPQLLHKINQTCEKAIKHYTDFVKSYMEKDGVTIRSNVDADEQRCILYAYFYLGRLFFKIINADPAVQVNNLTNSLKYYKLFMDGCAAHKDVAEAGLQAEMGVTREMVNLLPLKIATLQKRLTK